MTANNKQVLVAPQVSDVSLVSASEFDCIMQLGPNKYVCWGLFKAGPDFSLQLTHLSMNKMGSRGINHVSKIQTFSPYIVQSIEHALAQNIDADFIERFKAQL